jgi:hypothetical protein
MGSGEPIPFKCSIYKSKSYEDDRSKERRFVKGKGTIMQHVGERKDPSVIRLIVIVVLVLVLIVYAMLSFATGDWLWFSTSFRETPNAIVLHCHGESTSLDPGSFQFSKLKEIMNENLSGRKRWDPLTMSEGTYLDYQTNPTMIVVEYFYPEPIRVHSSYKFFSHVDNLIVPIVGRHSETNAVFGQADGVPTGGSLHIDSTEEFKVFVNNMDLCPINIVSGN